jgi:hypothetical protein
MGVRVPLSSVQAAIYDVISAAIPSVLVFNFTADPNPAMPYVVLGNPVRATQDDTKTTGGWSVTYQIDIYTAGNGTAQLDAILNEILGALTEPELTCASDNWDIWQVLHSWSAATESGTEKDPVIQHVTIELTIQLVDVS